VPTCTSQYKIRRACLTEKAHTETPTVRRPPWPCWRPAESAVSRHCVLPLQTPSHHNNGNQLNGTTL